MHGRLAVLQHPQEVVDQVLGDQLFLVHQDAADNQLLELVDVGAFKQGIVITNTADQALLGRQRNHILLADAQVVSGVAAHPLDGIVGILLALQVVPEYVDFVQYREAASPVVGVLGVDVLVPDRHIAGGYAGIGTEHKDNGVGPGQHADGQLRLGTQGVQARGIENAQAAFEQRMANADLGVTPGRYQYVAGVAAVVLQHVLVEPELAGLLGRYALGAGYLGQHFAHYFGVVLVQVVPDPVLRLLAQLLQGEFAGAGFDRQQQQVILVGAAVVEQLGGAHGGAARLGRQHALAIAGEEQGIDQLGLATGVFPGKGNGQLIFNEQLQAITDSGADVYGEKVVVLQPQPVAADLPDEFLLPVMIGLNLLRQSSLHFHRFILLRDFRVLPD